MKLKVVFIIFNIILVLLVLTVFFFPLIYVGGSFKTEFWRMNWIRLPLFIALILSVDIFFFKNKVLIASIETQDWKTLVHELEIRIYTKKRFSYRNTRLLADTLILLSDFSSINKLCCFLKEKKPKYLSKLALKFTAAKMISGDYAGLFEFTSEMKLKDKRKEEWLNFYSALALHMLKEYSESAVLFNKSCREAKNLLVKCLSSYFTVKVLKNYSKLTLEELEERELLIRSKIKKDYTKTAWKQYVDSEKQEIHVMILTKIIDEVNSWLF